MSMFVFTWKATGETIVLPTPSDDKQPDIDTLPGSYSPEEDKEYMKFHNKRLKKQRGQHGTDLPRPQ